MENSIELALFVALLFISVPLLGSYMATVFRDESNINIPLLKHLENFIYRFCSIDPKREMRWREYAQAMLYFNSFGFILLFGQLIIQGILPFNPQGYDGVEPILAFNIAVLTILTGLVYPLLITGIAQLIMPASANGPLQRFKSHRVHFDRPKNVRYPLFHPRPSAIDYDSLKPSGGSNLGPTSQKLKEQIIERNQEANQQSSNLLYSSGSGLDPHISIEAAYSQIPRISHHVG